MSRLLVVADSLAGGLGAAARSQARWFANAGWEVTVCAPADGEPPGSEARYQPLDLPRSARSVLALAGASARIGALVARGRPDVVHCHGVRCFAAARPVTWRAPFVTLHGSGAVPSDPPAYHAIRRLGVAIVPMLARGAFSAGPASGRWRFLPHASPVLGALEGLGPPEGSRPTILWLGRLEEPKRPDLFVRVVASAGGEVRGVVAGDGPLRAPVARLVRQLDAPVSLVGAVDSAERLRELMAESWCVALFSTHEAVSFAVQEAMWAGRAVVVSDLPGLRWLVGGDGAAGALVGDAAEATLAVRALLDPASAASHGAAAAARVRSQLTPDAPWPSVAECYRSTRSKR